MVYWDLSMTNTFPRNIISDLNLPIEWSIFLLWTLSCCWLGILSIRTLEDDDHHVIIIIMALIPTYINYYTTEDQCSFIPFLDNIQYCVLHKKSFFVGFIHRVLWLVFLLFSLFMNMSIWLSVTCWELEKIGKEEILCLLVLVWWLVWRWCSWIEQIEWKWMTLESHFDNWNSLKGFHECEKDERKLCLYFDGISNKLYY